MNPIEAVTHPDPYPYYARLVAESPFHRDPELGFWVATSAEAVTAVLTHPSARVRPAGEPLPIFRGFARMNDGEAHRALRPPVEAMLDALHLARVRDTVDRFVTPIDVNELAFTLPTRVLASLFGVEDDVTEDVRALVQSVFRGVPAPSAAERLLARFDVAQIGVMVQAYDATAGLILATLLAMARHGDTDVEDVLRFDSPVQNTRRFIAERCVIHGETLEPGDVVLVVVGAANHDPRANGEIFTFGIGAHACPGKTIAVTIARAAIARLLANGFDPSRIDPHPAYRPAPNVRIPILSVARR